MLWPKAERVGAGMILILLIMMTRKPWYRKKDNISDALEWKVFSGMMEPEKWENTVGTFTGTSIVLKLQSIHFKG